MDVPKKLEEGKSVNFDFVKSELEYILQNANFTEIQERVFNRLTSRER